MITIGAEGGLLLSGAECVALVPVLRDAVVRAEHAAGRARPDLDAITAAVGTVAAAYAAQRRLVLDGFGSGTNEFRDGRSGADSPDSEWVSVPEAARRLRFSTGYTRRLARLGRLRARRAGRGGAWEVAAADVAVWTPGRTA